MPSVDMFRSDFSNRFDAVVMFTDSNWATEPRSNRYHYATRFSAISPVIFVQPDRAKAGYHFSDTTHDNLKLLHVSSRFDQEQANSIMAALASVSISRPLLWLYSPYYYHAAAALKSPFCVFHATEDYFQPELKNQLPAVFHVRLSLLLGKLDLLVAVSQGVLDSYRVQGGYAGPALVLENGCDYEFWQSRRCDPEGKRINRENKVALYQGGINYRLDFGLIRDTARLLPDWEFRFCGVVDPKAGKWKSVRKLSNVRDLGRLSPDELASQSWRATVGIIPFIQSPVIVEKSLPLKAFEYVASELPIVTVPIRSLERWQDLFIFARDAEEFAAGIRRASGTAFDVALMEERRRAAKLQDYDTKFATLIDHILEKTSQKRPPKLNILVLYSPYALFTSTVHEHVSSLHQFSRHNVFYACAVNNARCLYDIYSFDVIVIHYSVRLSLPQHISPAVADAVKRADALKVLFIQDEYENTEQARRWIAELKLDIVFTCIPHDQARKIYPEDRFPRLRLITNLTGYVPENVGGLQNFKPLRERAIHVGYRGRPLPYRFGHLARDKYMIGYRMREECRACGVPHDIEVDEDKRIYGDAWYLFLSNCRAVLGTESGSNIFDDDGTIGSTIQQALVQNPWLTYDEVHERYLKSHEASIKMNQVSPRVFEAAAARAALILFEGDYSGVVEADVHYIPLKKDFSNLDEVFERLKDVAALEEMVERTYRDLISSGRFSYEKFVHQFDETLLKSLRARQSNVFPGSVGLERSLLLGEIYTGGLTRRPLPPECLVEPPRAVRLQFGAGGVELGVIDVFSLDTLPLPRAFKDGCRKLYSLMPPWARMATRWAAAQLANNIRKLRT
jgi:hypothetical protein